MLRPFQLPPAILSTKIKKWDFPGGPVVKTSPSNTEGVDLIPDQGSLDPICFRAKISKHKTEAML